MEHINNVLQKIKDTRKKQGLSHENMAFELGMSQAAYTNIEKNNSKLTVERLIRISDILGKPVYYFFEVYPNNIFHQDLKDYAVGYHKQDIENLYQDNRDMYDKLEQSYQTTVNILKEENEFLKSLLKGFNEKA